MLAHSDEDFNNKDLGNCMDYIHKHEENTHPGRSSFKALKVLYGRVNESVRSLKVEKMESLGGKYKITHFASNKIFGLCSSQEDSKEHIG